MRLSLVIVHHDAPECLKACLDSIARTASDLAPEVIVVDNASARAPDGIESPPGTVWIRNGDNRGFGAAVNQGAARSGGAVLVALNADIEFHPGALQALHGFFRDNAAERLGPVGGRLLFPDGRPQPSSGPFPTLAGLLWRRLLPPVSRKYYLREPGPGPVDWVTGAFLAVRRPVFEELGGFDEGFFLYYEDVDLCLRARERGYPAHFRPEAAACHRHPLAARAAPGPELRRVIRESRLRYFRKHRPSWESRLLERLD